MDNNQTYVITIGREFGSGGREIGQRIAEMLHIDYYDKELLAKAAEYSGVNANFFEKSDERSPSFFDNIFSYNPGLGLSSYIGSSSPISHDNIYGLQSNVIERIASERSCVIVGRTADYVLRNHPCCINVFLHADITSRARRIMQRGDVGTIDDAIELAHRRDKLRAGYYNYYTDKVWGRASSYHISIDTSKLTTDQAAKIITDYVNGQVRITFGDSPEAHY